MAFVRVEHAQTVNEISKGGFNAYTVWQAGVCWLGEVGPTIALQFASDRQNPDSGETGLRLLHGQTESSPAMATSVLLPRLVTAVGQFMGHSTLWPDKIA